MTPVEQRRTTSRWRATAGAVVVVALCTAIAAPLSTRLDHANLVMIYLIGVLYVAVRLGRAASVLASFLGVAAFDFFCVPPHWTLAVADTQFVITFAVMLMTALLVSTLVARLRGEAHEAERRERHAGALYALMRDLAAAATGQQVVEAAGQRVQETFGGDVTLLLPDSHGALRVRTGALPDTDEWSAARWTMENARPSGRGTGVHAGCAWRYIPLEGWSGVVGVLALRSDEIEPGPALHASRLEEGFGRQIALALDRVRLAHETEQNRLAADHERMRNALLSSVSHDLRTPLASITGATTTLLQAGEGLDAATRRELLQSVADEARRLNHLLANLLEMTRVEAGGVALRTDWCAIEEVVGAALARLDDELAGRQVELDVPADLPLVRVDPSSIEQVLVNLLENAVKYSDPGTPIRVRARAEPDALAVEVSDRGAGIPPGDEERVFEKFYRAANVRDARGAGLGLAICRAIVRAHGGVITAVSAAGGGARVRFTLPLASPPADAMNRAEALP